MKGKVVIIKMSPTDQYYEPLIIGSTVVYKNELHTVVKVFKNSSPSELLKIRIEPLLDISDLVVEELSGSPKKTR